MSKIDYPKEWDELPKRERKKKIKELKKQKEGKDDMLKKVRNVGIILVILGILVLGYKNLTRKSPEQIEFEQEVREVTLEDRVEDFEIEGTDHITQLGVSYNTNPPTSGSHLAQPADWGVYEEDLVDEAVVHSLEHGGIWISYKDISEEEKAILNEIGNENPESVIVSPRSKNDAKIAVASWGRYMKLEEANKAVIQKYIDTYKNQSPEKFAR